MDAKQSYGPKTADWLDACQIAEYVKYYNIGIAPIDECMVAAYKNNMLPEYALKFKADDKNGPVLCLHRSFLFKFAYVMRELSIFDRAACPDCIRRYVDDDSLQRVITTHLLKNHPNNFTVLGTYSSSPTELTEFIDASALTIHKMLMTYDDKIIFTTDTGRDIPYLTGSVSDFCAVTGLREKEPEQPQRRHNMYPYGPMPRYMADRVTDGFVSDFLDAKFLSGLINASPQTICSMLYAYRTVLSHDITKIAGATGLDSIRLHRTAVDRFCSVTGLQRVR